MSRLLLFLLLCGQAVLLSGQTEANYISALADHLNARQEVSVPSGRADLVTSTHAIEVERAPKWKNSIGQALWYGMQLNLEPGIILLIEEPAHRKYAIQLGSAIDYAGLTGRVKVWLYPDDFPGLNVSEATRQVRQQPVSGTGEFWLNLNGNKRHTSSCRYFQNTKRGRLCTVNEGIAAGCCH